MDTICILGYTVAILIAVVGIYSAISITKNCCDEGMCVFGVFLWCNYFAYGRDMF